MNRKLFTIGYAGCDANSFIELLINNNIECLIDIREIPISRKRGFSKTALKQALGERGINYEHHSLLGSPKKLRHAVRDDKDYESFFRGVKRHLQQPKAQEQLQDTIRTARFQRSCLMCFCNDWQFCHRSVVADAVDQQSHFAFEHLSPVDANRTTRAA